MADFEERREATGPKPRRGRRKARAERGLPDAQARLDLAATYLELQHARWPELAEGGELPPATEASAGVLAEEFRERFVSGGPPETEPVAPDGATVGGAYLRYSCDNSNPRSLAQQLRNVLERAARDQVYIPWAFVFADAAVTGTTAARRGYALAKEAVRRDGGPATLYVDELGRAARDAIETLKLGQLIDRLRRRLIGATDGFDSVTPHAQMMLSIFAMLHQWFSEQLRAKVGRGMRDAFRQGRNVRPPSFGYRLVPAYDAEGRPLLDRHGKPARVKAVDPDEAVWVEEAFRLYAERGRSSERIAKLFNEKEVGGRRTWDRALILKLLTRATYIGVEYEGMTRQVRDRDTGTVTVEKRPKSEWERRELPVLRIVSDELFATTQKLLRERSDAFAPTAAKRKRRSRTSAYPNALVRPVCECGAELHFGGSGGNGSFCCPNGSKGKHGCTFKSYKSVAIVTGAILHWIKDNLFTPELVAVAVEQANATQAEEAAKPREDVQPILRQIKEVQAKRDRLAGIIDDHPGGDLDALLKRLRGHERMLKTLRRRLKAVKATDALPREPVTAEQVEAELADMGTALGGDVEKAAPILAALTGPVGVREGDGTGRKGTPWVASFAFRPAAALAKTAEANGRPSAAIWKLVAGDAEAAVPVEVVIDKVPEYESLAPRFAELRAGGATVAAIAAAYGKPRKFVADSLKFAEIGVRPKGGVSKPKGDDLPKKPIVTKYKEIAAAVARLRDEEELSWERILDRLRREGVEVSEVTARRAYDHAHRLSEGAEFAIPQGRRIRGRSKRLGREVHAVVERLLLGGDRSVDDIAHEAGCSPTTVHRTKRRLRRKSAAEAA